MDTALHGSEITHLSPITGVSTSEFQRFLSSGQLVVPYSEFI